MELSVKSPCTGSPTPIPQAVRPSNITNLATPFKEPRLDIGETPKLPALLESSASSTNSVVVQSGPRFPDDLPRKLRIFLAQNGKAYSEIHDAGNPYALPNGHRRLDNIIRALAREAGITLRKTHFSELNDILQGYAETAGLCKPVWFRVAPIPGGIEIDLGDDRHTRVRITAGKVEAIEAGSETLFYRTHSCQPMTRPAEVGDLTLLKKYLNLTDVSALLFTAWLSYTLAHPKSPSSKFVILVLQGGQGSGKSALSKLILKLIDPSLIGVQILPSNGKDFAIATQNAHVLCFDNVRGFSQAMADNLCVAATGGALASRQLYTDADQQVIYLHVALVLNGIHSFIQQPDLAQRCLPIHLMSFSESARKSEAQLSQELEADLPAIQRGLFDLIAQVFLHLPTAKVTNPERMLDFVQWLAAMEMANGVPAGVYQAAYSEALHEGQRDSLLDNMLAAAVLTFAEDEMVSSWSGTPAEFLAKLNSLTTCGTQRSREWPDNPIALSKRLAPLQAGLLSQGVLVELSRGKHRTITVKRTGGAAHA